jgi:DNA-binding NarL/FixJ family response regulator
VTIGSGSARTSVVVADARLVVAQGLAAALSGHCRLDVHGVSTDAALLAEIQARSPRVVLVPTSRDGRIPDLLRCAARAASAATAVVVVGPHPAIAGQSADGIRAVLPTSATAPELARALAAIAAGSVVAVALSPPPPEPEQPRGVRTAKPELDRLTAREREVLGLLAQGLSTREVADAMSVSINTVRTHVNVVLHKLGVHSRLRAVALFADVEGRGHGR